MNRKAFKVNKTEDIINMVDYVVDDCGYNLNLNKGSLNKARNRSNGKLTKKVQDMLDRMAEIFEQDDN
jgi:uncharacterized protein YutD